ncbi:MAG: ATP-binding cassette domain-containing protein [Myxococcota bacterium]|nr:ATP-binding cassette domain-containing protein [Deltaproteobacteria bacterium]MDQ3333790.1 ATP-binding cassette domain-containing protein [Myxococcota bacterium]
MSNALVVEDVTKKYGNHVAVEHVSFTVPKGVVYGILGPNGAGKSTTLRMITDIIAPDGGKITILDGLAPGAQSAPHIGYLPEERGLYPKMKVWEMIEFMGELRGLKRAESKKRATAWLERLGLQAWAKNKVQDLSKGMQQKVQFATALIHEPALLILDEPWSGLDPINSEVLRDVVDEIRKSGRTVIFSTHGMEQAEKVCDAVCIIARGKKVLEGKLREIKRASAMEGLIALEFANDAAKAAARAVIEDKALVAEERPPLAGDHADTEVKLANGVDPQQLLAAFVGANVSLRRFEIVTPTLHQIFVDIVGEEAAVAARLPEEKPS